MHGQGHKIGDVRPDNIFINEDGQVKVATTYSWPSEQTNYSKSFYEKEITYLGMNIFNKSSIINQGHSIW